jgi:signal transduction histidine kinase
LKLFFYGVFISLCENYYFALHQKLRLQAKYRLLFKKEIEAEINALETERKRISADLHDGIAPVLLAAKMRLSALEELKQEGRQAVNKTLEYIENMNSRIRDIIGGLMLPGILLDKGPIEAADQFIDDYGLGKTQHIRISGYLPPLTDEASIHLYRIIQEIIINTCKHAGARRLEIIAMVEKKKVLLITADDGTGFEQDNNSPQKKGYGLLNIKGRVLSLNGTLHINSGSNTGTRYCIIIPLAGIIKTTGDATGNEL